MNCEIDRLVEVSTLQKRKISELECAAVEQTEQIHERGDMSRRVPPCHECEVPPTRIRKPRHRRNPCDECEEDNVILDKVKADLSFNLTFK